MKKLALALFLTYSGIACAGSSTSGLITRIFYMGDGTVLFTTAGTHTGVPSCGSSNVGRFAINGNTTVGRNMLAGLLAAYSTGTPVTIVGTNDCLVWPDTESVSYMLSP